MKPIDFKEGNKTLFGNTDAKYSSNVLGVDPLRIWTDEEQCVSCWKMSFAERLSALFFGKVWLAVLSGNRQPPVSLQVSKTYFVTRE